MNKVYYCHYDFKIVATIEEAVKYGRFGCIRLYEYKNSKEYSSYIDGQLPRFKGILNSFLLEVGFDTLD